MEKLKDFDIQIYNLSNKVHTYEYKIDSSFFDLFEGDLQEEGTFNIQIELDKRENIIEVDLFINGQYQLTCDRSLEEFELPVSVERKLLYKYGEEEKELEDDVNVITKQTQKINIAHFIYEFLLLAIPMKKLHPKYENEEDEEDEIIYFDESEETTDDEEQIDPRWAALKNLKNKN